MITKTYREKDLPIIEPIIRLRGDTLKSDPFYHLDPETEAAIDLTGSTITCKGTLSDGTDVDLTDYLVIDYAGGSYYLSVPPSVTNGATPWPAGFGSYDITIVDSLGEVITCWSGPLGLKEGEHA